MAHKKTKKIRKNWTSTWFNGKTLKTKNYNKEIIWRH